MSKVLVYIQLVLFFSGDAISFTLLGKTFELSQIGQLTKQKIKSKYYVICKHPV